MISRSLSKIRKVAKHFFVDSVGATIVEYSVMLALIAAVALASILAVGTQNSGFWQNNADEIETTFDDALDD